MIEIRMIKHTNIYPFHHAKKKGIKILILPLSRRSYKGKFEFSITVILNFALNLSKNGQFD